MIHRICKNKKKEDEESFELSIQYSTRDSTSEDDSLLPNQVQTIPIKRRNICHEITYCTEPNSTKPVDLGGGRYGRVYKVRPLAPLVRTVTLFNYNVFQAKYQEQFVAVKCIQREARAEHEKIMFDLIGSRSEYVIRLVAYISKYQDPLCRPVSIIVIPVYLNGDLSNYLRHRDKLTVKEAFALIKSLSCGLYELHRPSEGIENPKPKVVHRYI